MRAKKWDEGENKVRGGSSAGGFINVFCKMVTGFHRQAKLFRLIFFYKKKVPLDGQTRKAK